MLRKVSIAALVEYALCKNVLDPESKQKAPVPKFAGDLNDVFHVANEIEIKMPEGTTLIINGNPVDSRSE